MCEQEQKERLVIDRLTNLQRPENEKELSSQPDRGRSVGVFTRDFGMEAWDWPQGVGIFGMLDFYHATGDGEVAEYIVEWYKRRFDAGLPSRNVNTTVPLLALVSMLDRFVPEARSSCADWAKWVLSELPRTKDGGFQHTTTGLNGKGVSLNENLLWIDTLFMAILFTAAYGVSAGEQSYCDASLAYGQSLALMVLTESIRAVKVTRQ